MTESYRVIYLSFGDRYESERQFEMLEEAERWAVYLRTFGYVTNAWVEGGTHAS